MHPKKRFLNIERKHFRIKLNFAANKNADEPE